MTICQYEIKSLLYNELKQLVKLPKFQRSIVWSDDSRKNFIETIRNGFPFGSLLLYEINDSSYKYQLVDGLQRFSAIQDYEENKYKYVKLENIANNEFNAIFDCYEKFTQAELSNAVKEKFIKIISEEFKKYNEPSDKALPFVVIEKLTQEMPILNDGKLITEIGNLISQIEKKVQQDINLSVLSLPVIVFRGNKSELPSVFERINSGGTKLSKYEIFAASWADINYKINDNEILQWVDSKYEDMIEKSGIYILGYEPGSIKDSGEINLFEYAYAVGKIIREKCPEIFENREIDASQIDSIGFALLIVCLGGTIAQMGKLPDYFTKDSSEQLINLKDKIVECSQKANDILKKYIVSSDEKICTKYMEAQIVSIIATLFKIRYSIGTGLKIRPNDKSNSIVKIFEKNMPKHYLYDLIKGYWDSTGDKKVAELLGLNINDNKYLKSIEDENWRVILDEWMSTQETKLSKNVNITQKLFLNFLDKLSTKPQTLYSNYSFDVEHIIPIKRLTDRFKEGSFSAIGNLCFLPSFENRSKKDKTLYEQIDEKSIIYKLDVEVLTKGLHYAERSEIDFIKGSSFTKEQYLSFLQNRHTYLAKTFVELVRNI